MIYREEILEKNDEYNDMKIRFKHNKNNERSKKIYKDKRKGKSKKKKKRRE